METSILRERLRHRRNALIIRWRSVEENLREEGEWDMWQGGMDRMLRQTAAIDRTLRQMSDIDAPRRPKAA
jgi:hypothetical protein